MLKGLRQSAAYFSGSLGYCQRCVRKAFLASAGMWALALASAASPWSQIWIVPVLAAVGLTILWVAHLVAYAGKVAATDSAKQDDDLLSRRSLLPIFLRALASAALVTSFSHPAFADSPCGGWPDQGLPCGPCERRNTVSSPCLTCASCTTANRDCRGNC